MTFRKNSPLFYQSEIWCIVMALSWLALIPMLGLGLPLIFAILSLGCVLAVPNIYNEFITINENGIICHNSKEQLWAYKWDDIAELRRSSRFRMPSMEVIVFDQNGSPEPYAYDVHYFQLGKSAKEAIKKFYKPTAF